MSSENEQNRTDEVEIVTGLKNYPDISTHTSVLAQSRVSVLCNITRLISIGDFLIQKYIYTKLFQRF